MAAPRERRNSNSKLLQELDALSQTLFQPQANRRTNSLALPRSSASPLTSAPPATDSVPAISNQKTRSRRMSMSPFRTRPKSEFSENDEEEEEINTSKYKTQTYSTAAGLAPQKEDKKGIWGWKPIRALAHIRMQKISCLFSVEVVCIQQLPTSMNGLRMLVTVRKKETKDGAVQTMPARVSQGCADFEETLFIKCHVYFSGKPPKFEPHPFVITALAIEAPELDFGKNTVDVSLMVKESIERNLEGERIRQWDAAFKLSGKAKGGELVVKLGFQIMEDGGFEIYNQTSKKGESSSGVARKQSKNSFSVSSPKVSRLEPPIKAEDVNSKGMDEFKLDEFKLDEPAPVVQPPLEQKQDDLDFLEFDVIERGVEVEEVGGKEQEVTEVGGGKEQEVTEEEEEVEAGSSTDVASLGSEVVKEVVHDSVHQTRLTELDSIAQQIKALESMVNLDDQNSKKQDEGEENQELDADEETVTREFLQMLELDDGKDFSFNTPEFTFGTESENEMVANSDANCYLSDLGKGLGSIVQTRDGGYLAAMNPFDMEVSRKDSPKLVMQLSKSILIKDQGTGIEILQKLAALGPEGLASKLALLASMDDLMNKTAEQIAFEGIASAIISGRSKEGASSTAAKSVATLKTMASAMTEGRKERILTGIWNVKEEPVALEEILQFSLQKIEVMAVQALKIQGEVHDEEAPFDISPLTEVENPLDSIAQPEDITELPKVTMLVIIKLRDPIRRYDTVGAPMIALIQATKVEEAMFKVTSMHVGGVRVKSGEKERLKATQWLVAYGIGKSKKKGKKNEGGKGDEFIWSISSRVMADMWMNAMRNPNVKFAEQL